jgi:hypothetical protein
LNRQDAKETWTEDGANGAGEGLGVDGGERVEVLACVTRIVMGWLWKGGLGWLILMHVTWDGCADGTHLLRVRAMGRTLGWGGCFVGVVWVLAWLGVEGGVGFGQEGQGWVGRRVILQFGSVPRVGAEVVDNQKLESGARGGLPKTD